MPSLLKIAESRTDEYVAGVVKDGGGGRMPGFGSIGAGQRQAIVDYLFGREKPEPEYGGLGRRERGARLGRPAVFLRGVSALAG